MLLIEVKTSFIGFHCWPEAPDEVAFLRNMHRHVFTVRARFQVNHNNRDLEFFIMQQKVDDAIEEVANWSCEMWAQDIAKKTGAIRVSVFEDEENGAIYINDKPSEERIAL